MVVVCGGVVVCEKVAGAHLRVRQSMVRFRGSHRRRDLVTSSMR